MTQAAEKFHVEGMHTFQTSRVYTSGVTDHRYIGTVTKVIYKGINRNPNTWDRRETKGQVSKHLLTSFHKLRAERPMGHL